MMTNDERIQALEELGYTERESAFLCLAALHSGYFLRRQYSGFLGHSAGCADDTLVRKLISKEHAREISTSRRTLLYHLCSRPLYGAIGQPDNRHRRERPPFAIKAKLMALDFVLQNPGNRFLATEEEKVAHFAGNRGVPKDQLPAKAYRSHTSGQVTERYFVEKFPIYLASEPAFPAVVAFSYIDEGIMASLGFETYLKRYLRLFRSLRHTRITYVGTRERGFRAAEKTFNRFFGIQGHNPSGGRDPDRRLIEYFQLEDLYRAE